MPEEEDFVSLTNKFKLAGLWGCAILITLCFIVGVHSGMLLLNSAFILAWAISWITGAIIAHSKGSHSFKEIYQFVGLFVFPACITMCLILRVFVSSTWRGLDNDVIWLLLLVSPLIAALYLRIGRLKR